MARTSMLSATFTRPADTTAYAANDLVANSTTAGSVVPMSFAVPTGYGPSIELRSFRVRKSGTSITNADFDVYLWNNSSPTVSVGDNAALVATNVVAANGAANFLGILQGGQMLGFSDGGKMFAVQAGTGVVRHRISSLSTNVLYGLLAAQGAYTPASAEVFVVEIEVEHIEGT